MLFLSTKITIDIPNLMVTADHLLDVRPVTIYKCRNGSIVIATKFLIIKTVDTLPLFFWSLKNLSMSVVVAVRAQYDEWYEQLQISH